MDPAEAQVVEALSGEPRECGAPVASAPAAARWLQRPTPHDSKPELGTYEWWLQLLLSWGRALANEDEQRFGKVPGEEDDAQ